MNISSVLARRSGRTEIVRIESLAPANSPRLAGEVHEHTQRLAESESDLPPILVHRPTMRIIDGTHRVKAMAYRGRDEIEAEFYDGSLEDAFVLSVHANVQRGLPLSLADRRAAARRILATHAAWSDRAIAQLTGLSAKTISDLRCATAENQALHTRNRGLRQPRNTAVANGFQTLGSRQQHPQAAIGGQRSYSLQGRTDRHQLPTQPVDGAGAVGHPVRAVGGEHPQFGDQVVVGRQDRQIGPTHPGLIGDHPGVFGVSLGFPATIGRRGLPHRPTRQVTHRRAGGGQHRQQQGSRTPWSDPASRTPAQPVRRSRPTRSRIGCSSLATLRDSSTDRCHRPLTPSGSPCRHRHHPTTGPLSSRPLFTCPPTGSPRATPSAFP